MSPLAKGNRDEPKATRYLLHRESILVGDPVSPQKLDIRLPLDWVDALIPQTIRLLPAERRSYHSLIINTVPSVETPAGALKFRLPIDNPLDHLFTQSSAV
jgi:hypothetical protein